MMTVRFPSGLSITYNNANFINRSTDGIRLYPSMEDSHANINMIAFIQSSAGAVIESVIPCKTELLLKELTDTELLKEFKKRLQLKEFKGYSNSWELSNIKKMLKSFNCKTAKWSS